jgi:hypothetical protein
VQEHSEAGERLLGIPVASILTLPTRHDSREWSRVRVQSR